MLELLGAADAELLFGAVDAVIAEDPKGRPARCRGDGPLGPRPLPVRPRPPRPPAPPPRHPDGRRGPQHLRRHRHRPGPAIRPKLRQSVAATLVRTIDELAQALTAVREGDDARMAVEIALLKAARPDLDPSTEGLLRRIERLEQGTEAPRAAGPVARRGAPPVVKRPRPPSAPPAAEASPSADDPPAGGERVGGVRSRRGVLLTSPASGSASDETPHSEQTASGSPDTSGTGRQDPRARSTSIRAGPRSGLQCSISCCRQPRRWRRPSRGPDRSGFDADESAVTIGFPADHTFNKRKAEAPDKREQMAAALETVLGEKLRPVYAVLDGEDVPPEADGGRRRRSRRAGGEDQERIRR